MKTNFTLEPLLKGSIYCTENPGDIPDAIYRNFQIVTLLENSDALPYPNCNIVNMSCLLPPVEAIYAYEESIELGKKMYFDYLKTQEQAMAILLAYIHKKEFPCVIYTTQDENEAFHLLEVLTDYFKFRFNLLLGKYNDPRFPFTNLGNNQYNIINTIYENRLMSTEEYACLIDGSIPTPKACARLLSEYNYGFQDLKSCVMACTNILKDIKRSYMTGKKPVMQFFNERLSEKEEKELNDLVMNSPTRFG